MSATEATELKLFIDNDGGDLYRRQTTSIVKNLATKKARDQYKRDLAVKAFGSTDQPWRWKHGCAIATAPSTAASAHRARRQPRARTRARDPQRSSTARLPASFRRGGEVFSLCG